MPVWDYQPNPNAQKVVDACEESWDAYKTDCSGFVKAVAAQLGITISGDADDIVDAMASAPWVALDDGAAAQLMAHGGCFVLVGQKGEDHIPPHNHGHVAVIVPGPVEQGKYPHAYWGSLGGIGAKDKSIRYSFNAASRDNVVYAYRFIP